MADAANGRPVERLSENYFDKPGLDFLGTSPFYLINAGKELFPTALDSADFNSFKKRDSLNKDMRPDTVVGDVNIDKHSLPLPSTPIRRKASVSERSDTESSLSSIASSILDSLSPIESESASRTKDEMGMLQLLTESQSHIKRGQAKY